MKLFENLNIRKQVIGENILYAIIWLAVYLVPFMSAGLMSENVNIGAALASWLKIIPYYVLFLINNYLLYPYLYARKRYTIYALVGAALILVIFTSLDIYERAEHIGIAWPFGPTNDGISRQHLPMTVFPLWGNLVAGALMLAANNIIRKMYSAMKADEDNAHLERQNIQAEMSYLKHQINPHFLMNSLNNIHALVDIDTEVAKQSIIQLSDMMRYVVYDTGGDAIALKRDIKFIEEYIELMRIRYTDDVDITFAYPQNLNNKIMVPPLIFVVFVENAFKHGVSYNAKSYIHIDIAYDNDRVVAHFENSVHASNTPRKSGIGLENVRKRLDLIYGKAYKLEIDNKAEDRYCITLEIPTINDKMYSHR